MDEFLFSVYVVKTGNWYVSMEEMNEILKQGLNYGEKMVVLLQQNCWPGGSPSQDSWGCSFSHPRWVKAISGLRCPTVVSAGFMNIELQRTPCPTEKTSCFTSSFCVIKIHTCLWDRNIQRYWVWNAAIQDLNTPVLGRGPAIPVQSTHSLLAAGTASRPRQHWTSDASLQAIGFLKVLS